MPPVGKLGVRPIEQRSGIIIPKFGDYVSGGDPFPPVSPTSTFDGTSGVNNLGMLGNDVWGDCVFAGYVHARMIQAWLAGVQPVGNFTDYSVWPTDDQTITAYLLYNGSPDPTDHNPNGPNMAYDNGADPDEALLWFMVNGIGPLSPLEEDGGGIADVNDWGEELEGAVANFGVIWNAIMVSQEAMNEFESGQPFSSLATDFIGGHLFPIAYRDGSQGKGPTWSVEWPFTWPWWRVARELSRVILSPEIMKSLKFFNATQLTADIKDLGGQIGIQKGKPAPSAANYTPSGKFWSFVKQVAADVEKVIEDAIEDLEHKSATPSPEVGGSAMADEAPAENGTPDDEATAAPAEPNDEGVEGGHPAPDDPPLVPGYGVPQAVLPTDALGRPVGVPFGEPEPEDAVAEAPESVPDPAAIEALPGDETAPPPLPADPPDAGNTP